MLFFNPIFYFPIWSTVPAKDRKIQNWVYCGVQRALTLYREEEENPPPTYTWTPCDPKQVCNKNTLQILQFFNDTDYTCRVANVYGGVVQKLPMFLVTSAL